MTELFLKNITLQIGQQKLCQHFSMDMNGGEIVGVLGPNGSGKSTFLHALCGLHPLLSGGIFLNHHNIQQLKPQIIAQSVGILFQEMPTPFPQTVWEYCIAARFPHWKYFARENDEDKNIVFNALSLFELDKKLHTDIRRLSGGEKKRLNLAALFTQTPKIFLLDEPTNHLDIRHRMILLKHLRELAQYNNSAIIMSLHDINVAESFCDRIVFIDNGEIIHGEKNKMLTEENLYLLYQQPMHRIAYGNKIFWQYN